MFLSRVCRIIKIKARITTEVSNAEVGSGGDLLGRSLDVKCREVRRDTWVMSAFKGQVE